MKSEYELKYKSTWRQKTFDPNAPVRPYYSSSKRSAINPQNPSPFSQTARHPRLICLAFHWRGHYIPSGTISSQRFRRLFEPGPSFRLTRFANQNELITAWLNSPPSSVPIDALPLLVRFARKRGFLLSLNKEELTK